MEQVLSVLYGVSGLAATALYIPQILRYHRDPLMRRSISLLTWGGWIGVTLVTILYAIYVVKSPLFALVAGINALAQLTVLAYGITARISGTLHEHQGRQALHTVDSNFS
ncbi:hypothetical protein [Noviherbaspirillum sp. Root189]|uniref:hypothetical protein n=1 Tax=Noviherbaspirillum sp. Root189 TaxID=1736487 RepID=UPI00070A245A|nr:hypothetical protein [Noviherbaspirillum sp. Root189]KRB94012.1 hypothetical protein ASE07_00215 [Noviherbaspirillum sp. Root189]